MYGCPFASCTYENRLRRSVERHMEDHQDIPTVDPIRNSQTNNTTWKCQDCPLDFAYLSALRLHRVIHTDERPFECKHCPFSTQAQVTRDRHQERHVLHAFPCLYCGYNGDSWNDTVSHMGSSHSNRKQALESRRNKIVKRTLENRELVAAGLKARRSHRRSPSRAASTVLAAAAAGAADHINLVPQAQTAAISPKGQTRFQPCGICGHIYTNAADFQLHDCEGYADELDESWENEFHEEDDL